MTIKKFENFHEKSEDFNYMTLINLKKLVKQSDEILKMIESGEEMDHWATNHVATSADDIEEVYNYMTTRDSKKTKD